jgi:hypothetical protein
MWGIIVPRGQRSAEWIGITSGHAEIASLRAMFPQKPLQVRCI